MMAEGYAIEGEILEGSARALRDFLGANPGPVTVLINSYGGIAAEGAAMMAALERHGAATVQIDGIAASAASLAAMGGSKIEMHKQGLMMIHEPRGLAWGVADAHRKSAGVLDQMTSIYAAGYARATGNPEDWVRDWMRSETWLNADEALELHFIDAIEGSEGEPVFAAFDYGQFMNAPRDLVELAKKQGWALKPQSEGTR
ncbi:MAG: Clp protease ClpP [Rhodobacteraceae bacterium]|nr:MAG: Clp protease ClpP [Paracoccaceae bacterium]